MADTLQKVDIKKRKQARRVDVGALLAATDEQRTDMAKILSLFKALPETLRVVVASQVRKEMENGS